MQTTTGMQPANCDYPTDTSMAPDVFGVALWMLAMAFVWYVGKQRTR